MREAKCNNCQSRAIEFPEPPDDPDVYAIALWPEGDRTDLHKPYCRECASNDVFEFAQCTKETP